MPFTYTNRKGSTYYLCQAITKTGKTRFYFAREPKGSPVEHVPSGYQVEESVNGIVSLAKARPQVISTEELASVESALKKHPKGHNYKAVIKRNQIVIYESQGSDFVELISQMGWAMPVNNPVQEFNEHHAQFSSIMRFILDNTEDRIFIPQRWCFLGSIDDWINAGDRGKIDLLVKELIPKLGTDGFFELY